MTAREVELTGGAPWGFRMHGGADQNQPLRISRVNPGRKASISGMREGDVISSINGRATKGMSNADAHAMLRSAGPVLRLGLNEDREMSPRRRSIGKGSELKRPSQLVAEVQGCRATPQPPVYATTATVQSLQRQPPPSPYKSLNSVPAALNSTQLVKSVVQNEEPVRFHPTNPFYTTLPSSYSSGSKLPVPSGRSTVSSLDRSKNKYNDHKSPAMFTNIPDSGPSSLPYSCNNETESINGYDSYKKTCPPSGGKYSHLFETSNMDQFQNQHQINSSERARNTKNPFDPKRNSDPFEKYLRPDNKLNGDCKYENKSMSNSISDSNFHSNEEITKRSTITEHKISEIQEVKTVKKIVLNGCDDKIDRINEHSVKFELPSTNGKSNEVNGPQQNFANTKETGLSSYQSPRSEHGLSTPVHERNDYSLQFNQDERQCNSTSAYDSTYKENRSAETQADKVVSKPPVNSPGTPTNDHSPGPKREYYIDFT